MYIIDLLVLESYLVCSSYFVDEKAETQSG